MPDQLARIFAKERIPKSLHVFVRQDGSYFRAVYQHQYPQAVEEVVYTERFKTSEEAQKFIDVGLLAQRIYRNLGKADF